MKVRILVKAAASLLAIFCIVFTGMLCYHVMVQPMDGIFSTLIPQPEKLASVSNREIININPDSTTLPDFDPAKRIFQKAHELVVMGDLDQGYEKFLSIVNFHPNSPIATDARQIVSQIHLDRLLSSDSLLGRKHYEVESGDSYSGITAKNQTTLEMIMHINRMTELSNLQPKQKLLLFPLNFRVLIEPHRESISLWDQGKFLCEFPILSWVGTVPENTTTSLSSRRASIQGRSISPTSPEFFRSEKSILLLSPSLLIYGVEKVEEDAPAGIYLNLHDMEDLYLLTRQNNEVEIRSPKK